MNASGCPIAWEIYPGNTADQEAMKKIVTALSRRFHIGHVTVVADRGMISKDTIKLLAESDQTPFNYVLGCRMRQGSATIDEDAVRRDARLDGKFVMRTNTNLSAAEVAPTYQSLWRVERTFREQKSTLEVRPIYHHRDDTAIGHIVASFLALRLEVDRQQRLDERQAEVSWPDVMRDLGQVQSVLLELDENRYQLRTDMVGSAHHAFAAAGMRPPSPVTCLGSLA